MRKNQSLSWAMRIVIGACFAIGMTSSSLYAEVVNITQGSDSGYMMTDGNTYVIQDSVSFSNSIAGGSGMTVEDGATVVLYVPTGITLTATGANGCGRIGGGAGICVPSNATLVVTGEGKVVATGGNAGDGGDGKDGGDGSGVNYNAASLWSGRGGAGGFGGGGSGAAIGGAGGFGGILGNGGAASDGASSDTAGINGVDGGDGEISGAMGHIYILGRILTRTQSGGAGAKGVAGSGGIKGAYTYYNSYKGYASGGGGGGGGGAGAAPKCPIGAGGSSGGGGGGGGSGGAGSYLAYYYDSKPDSPGGFGEGGLSQISTGESGGKRELPGGDGGCGGSAGAEGDEGVLGVSSMAVVDVDRTKLSSETHPAAQYTITFDATSGMLSSETNIVTVTLGCALPDCISAPVREGYLCGGWLDDSGIKYYGGDGTKILSSYDVPSNTMLHALWVNDPNALVITPTNGTTFSDSLTISILSSVNGAAIHFTLDGSEPTLDSAVYSRKFRIHEKTTVKAIAVCEGWTNSGVVVANYALGQCPDPMIVSSRGDNFTYGQTTVSIRWDCEDGVLRYTVDGSEVTGSSPEYTGAFVVNETTAVKAKAFGVTYFDSEQVELTVTREWVPVATPVISATETFTGTKNRVSISCATGDATIYYTLDGSAPTTRSTRYEKPFCVTGSCTVRAIAVRDEFLDSEVATLGITRVWSIGETMGKPDHVFTTSGDEAFTRSVDMSAVLGESMRSGAVANGQTSILSTVVVGPGELSFVWKTSCEEDYPLHEWDHAEFCVDGEIVAKLDGVTEWQKITHQIADEGEHVVEWRYVKDESEYAGEDCMWVSEYSWTSEYTETQTTDNPVPYSWLKDKCSDVVEEYDSFEKVAKQVALNGRLTVEQCYVAGVDPESATNDFKTVIKIVDGVPRITWDPDLKASREYKILGRETLDDGSVWQYPTNSLHRFFKVTVEMP